MVCSPILIFISVCFPRVVIRTTSALCSLTARPTPSSQDMISQTSWFVKIAIPCETDSSHPLWGTVTPKIHSTLLSTEEDWEPILVEPCRMFMCLGPLSELQHNRLFRRNSLFAARRTSSMVSWKFSSESTWTVGTYDSLGTCGKRILTIPCNKSARSWPFVSWMQCGVRRGNVFSASFKQPFLFFFLRFPSALCPAIIFPPDCLSHPFSQKRLLLLSWNWMERQGLVTTLHLVRYII